MSDDTGDLETRLGKLRGQIRAAAALSDQTERLLEVAAIVAEALSDVAEPVVVGGLALAYWSDSAFRTGDIDVVVPRPPEFQERLASLGFEQAGREWILSGHDIIFEAPGAALEPGDEAEAVELPSGRRVLVLSPEDLLLWRLREWIHWQSVSGFEQAAYLFASEPVDRRRLDRRALQEGLTPALAALRQAIAEIEAGRTFDTWDLIELAKSIASGRYPEGE